MAAKGKKPYYIEPKVFKESLQKYYDTDILTDDLAENIKKIAYGLSYNASFINYTYKDDMIGDALIKMYSALKHKKFNFEKATNPFSYFTTIAYHAFIYVYVFAFDICFAAHAQRFQAHIRAYCSNRQADLRACSSNR